MKRVSLAIIALAIAALLCFANLFSSVPALVKAIESFLLPNFSLNLSNLLSSLAPIILLALLIIARYKEARKVYGVIIIVLGAVVLLASIIPLFSLFRMYFGYDLRVTLITIEQRLTPVFIGTLLIIQGASLDDEKKTWLLVEILGAVALLVAGISIILTITLWENVPDIIPILTLAAISEIPRAINTPNTGIPINEHLVKIIVGIAATVLLVVLFINVRSCSSSSGSPSGKACLYPDCKQPAVTTGDSVYCSTHSNRCGECGCYIDADAMFCMDCLRDALS